MIRRNSCLAAHAAVRAAAVAMGWSAALALIAGSAPPAAAADAEAPQMAQFQLPQPGAGAEAPALPQRLTYQYTIGTESDVRYRVNPDLDSRLSDDALILAPQLNGSFTYRPNDWLESTLELIVEREIPVHEESVVMLPGGQTGLAEKRHFSLLVEQAFVTIKNVIAPFEVTLGRRNYEDERHWLYDTSLDAAAVAFQQGAFQVRLSGGREAWVDLDLLQRQRPDRINTYMLYADYRDSLDNRLAAYSIVRDDRDRREGRLEFLGARAMGMPSRALSYWAELAYLGGQDESSRNLSGHAFDIGATYRFHDLPLHPNVTLGFAFGTGDGRPDNNTNTEFRQTGLQSNEARFGGVPNFKVYGEALDPELSNLQILTAAVGVWPARDVSVDLVYHHYWLDKIAEELRNSALTARMNQVGTRLSKDIGGAFDVIVGLRRLFGLSRLGVDLRGGWFFPGQAFLTDEGGTAFRKADKAVAVIAKFWW